MKTKTKHKLALALSLALGLPTALLAQAAPSAPIASAVESETLVLDKFVISTETDNGYIAVDSLAGGRTNTPIKFTPTVMSSLTSRFLEDANITNVRDALKWSPNVVEIGRASCRERVCVPV